LNNNKLKIERIIMKNGNTYDKGYLI